MIFGFKDKKAAFYFAAKRTIDVVGAFVLLIVFSPILLITSLLIAITSPGPVLVEKENKHMRRVGRGGRLFRLYKFRSMMVKADVLEKEDPRFKKVYIEKRTLGFYKAKNDPRVTPIGKFIRRYSIDEMPQLLNVLKGEMSIVGPRPYLPEELKEQMARYPGTERYVRRMHKAKPGITGFWQVSGRSDVAFDKRIVMDAYYADKKSLLLDFLIMLKTPWAMITGKGAV